MAVVMRQRLTPQSLACSTGYRANIGYRADRRHSTVPNNNRGSLQKISIVLSSRVCFLPLRTCGLETLSILWAYLLPAVEREPTPQLHDVAWPCEQPGSLPVLGVAILGEADHHDIACTFFHSRTGRADSFLSWPCLLVLLRLPTQSNLESIQMCPRKEPFVLEHADDNAGCDCLLVGEFSNCLRAAW